MNLKEAFRYQRFLDSIFARAGVTLTIADNCLRKSKKHLCNKSNPDAEDFVEDVVTDEEILTNDEIVQLMVRLIEEKERLTVAINKAKQNAPFDIDAAVATNKYIQQLNRNIDTMMMYRSGTWFESGIGHKFNIEGNQVEYRYDIEVTSSEKYDKETMKTIMKDLMRKSDKVSADIDAVKVNTVVEYEPIFDVNDSFEDVLAGFLKIK